jgi:serine/threonine-protein kinase
MPSITDSIGRVLGGRYRLVTALGTGASAHVYLADDVTLHRRVAIKVLHPALSGDANFLKRFRAEALAAAALNHPDVMQVYDWGEEGGEPYLVLEYLSGGSLRQVFDTGVLLTPAQAVRVGIEAAAGLDYAHGRGVIHRDIKPANLLFGGDRRLRIADFGLARALAEASWTEPAGAILGTARYSAPEQVEGWVLDGKADVYALALVLYEAVTGEAPFIGDTTVATLMARVGTLLPEHSALGPLNDVLVWAAAPDPAERYDAAQFGLRLQALAVALPEPDPLPLAEPAPVTPSDDIELPTVRPSRPVGLGVDPTELGIPTVLDRSMLATAATGTVVTGTAATGTAVLGPDPLGSTGGPDRPTAATPVRRRRWPWWVASAVVVVALVATGAVLATSHKLFTPSHPVPVLVGRTPAQAEAVLAKDKFHLRTVGHRTSITLAAGRILSQRPAPRAGGAAATAKEGATIAVVLSAGPPPVAIPSLTTAATCTAAVQQLAAVHLVGVCPAAAAQYSSTVVAGAVVSTSPAGTAPYGSTVTVITSKGHAPVGVPTLPAASTYTSASAALGALGFHVAQPIAYSATVPSGQVIGTTPAPSAGPQPYGSTVTVQVSEGPQPVTIPDLVSQSVAAATGALQALGLQVAGPYGPAGATRVLSTDPAAGTSVKPGSTVYIYSF